MNATSREIVKRSGSNLAFALAVLPEKKRYDMGVFYAFCRVIDDIADEPDVPGEERIKQLARWHALVSDDKSIKAEDGIEKELVDLKKRYAG